MIITVIKTWGKEDIMKIEKNMSGDTTVYEEIRIKIEEGTEEIMREMTEEEIIIIIIHDTMKNITTGMCLYFQLKMI